MSRTADPAEHDLRIAAGAGVNILGIVGKAALPASLILITRLFGPEVMGLYYLATRIIEAAFNLTASGFNDGVLMYASRYVDYEERRKRLYQMLASAFVFTMAISALLVLAAFTVGPPLLERYNDWSELPELVMRLSLAIPFMAVPVLVVAATKALQIMRWDALIFGALQPILLVLLAIGAHVLDLGVNGLAWAYVLTYATMTVLATWVFTRYFEIGRLVKHIFHLRPFTPLISFAVPQNLNMAFGRLVTDLDVLMLGYFGFSKELVAFYGIGAQIVRNVRQVKLAFSGSFSPVVARYHEAGQIDELNRSFTMVTRWTTTLIFPLAALVMLLRGDLLILFHSTFTYDSTFVILLIVPPMLSCLFGLSGNIVVMTGHPRWNLFNSLVAGGLNFTLNYLLIPLFGLMGAATATVLTSLTGTMLQLLEVWFLLRVRLLVSDLWKPYAAALPIALGVWAALTMGSDQSISLRIGACLLSVGVFVALMVLLGIPGKDKEIFLFWRRKKA